MGTKKKSKGNKLARMSEEERIRYLQHRAAIEEEARRRKEQLISIFLKNKLKKEEVFSRLNTAKINQQWRQVLRQIKCQELKQEIEDLKKWFDYTLNKKNEAIKLVMADLDEAENQHVKMHWTQMETYDKLIQIYSGCIDDYEKLYDEEKNCIYRKAVADISDIRESYKDDVEQLQTAGYRMEETFEEALTSLTSRHTLEMDEMRNDMLTELENLRNSRERQIEDIWRKMEVVLKNYWEQTEDRRRQYLIMKEAGQNSYKQIFENNQLINSVIDSIKRYKDYYSKIKIDKCRRIESQKCEREKIRKIFQDLKCEMMDKTKQDKKTLHFMNGVSSQIIDYLKEILAKGEQILKLYGLCRNLENRDECSFLELSKEQKQTEEEEDINKKTETDSSVESNFEIIELDKFWKRYNEALLEKKALTLHCRALSKEAKYLKTALKNYLSDLVVKRPESKISFANGVQFRQQKPQKKISSAKEIKSQKWVFKDFNHEFFNENQMLSITIRKPLTDKTVNTAIAST